MHDIAGLRAEQDTTHLRSYAAGSEHRWAKNLLIALALQERW